MYVSGSPCFQLEEWNSLAESRSCIERFKTLSGEIYYQNIWDNDTSGIAVRESIVVQREGEIYERELVDAEDADAVLVEPIAESVPSPSKIIKNTIIEIIENTIEI